VGDSVDNIKGVPGIGEKTAAKLLKQYGTLDQIIAHAHEIPQKKMKENLLASIENGVLEKARKLVKLRTDVPMELDWENWRRRDWDGEKLLALFQSFGFRRFSEQVRSTLKQSGAKKNQVLVESLGPTVIPKPVIQRDLFSEIDFEFGANAESDDWGGQYELIDTPKTFESFLKQLKKQTRFAFDLETTGIDPLRSEIVGYAFSWEAKKGYYLPVRAPEGEKHLDPAEAITQLKPIFESGKIQKLNQNIKYDLLALRHAGILLQGVCGDSMIAHYLLHSMERSHNLDYLTKLYFKHDNISIDELIGKGKNQKRMDEVPVQQVAQYAAEDADAAWRLCEKLESDLDQAKLRPLYDELEVPLIEVLAELEFNGIGLDVPFLAKLSEEMAQQLLVIEEEIHTAAERKFNIASPKQLREVLFEELKLPVQKRTDTTNEASTDQETLEKLARLDHPKAGVAVKIVEHRQISKLKGTYVDALPLLVNPNTRRLHTSFNQTVAATGRLSSSDPNLQNIPMRTEQGRQIRQAFLPQAGWKLLTADYSQIELRLLAEFSQDANLLTAFREDRDIHTSVAAEIFAVEESKVTSAQRRVAKTVNFGVIYGMSAHGLAERLEMARSEADRFIKAYFGKFPRVLEYQDALLAKVRKTGYGTTVLGRRRVFDPRMIRPKSSYQQRNQAEREAINMEIQGSAADLMKRAMLNVHRRLKSEKRQTRMLLTVHDELVFEVPPSELNEIASLVREEMTTAMKFEVPLKVDLAVGDNWLDVEDLN
jgi:DNA polymerase-1